MTVKQPVYAIVRIDKAGTADVDLIDFISVTSILASQTDAEAEVLRLNELNQDKGSDYYWVKTRFYPEGKNSPEQP